MFNMLGAIGQFETEIRSERQMEGIHKAKSKGIKFGRQNRLSEQQQHQLHQDRTDGLLIRELMQKYNFSKASVYRYLGADVKS
jgi:DNA invertase Pin-like site-specific DNA recombinase